MAYVSLAGLPRMPRWLPQQAVAYALGEVISPDMNYQNQCDHFVAWCYGYEGSGYVSAIAHWNAIPANFRMYTANPPSGALCFYNIGNYGHATLCVGPGLVASTDIKRVGKVDVVPISYITKQWGAQYLGATQPYLVAAWGENPNPPKPIPVVSTKDWFDMATKDDLKAAIREVLAEPAIQNDDGPSPISRDTALYRAYSQSRKAVIKLGA